jgi:hypothetical protein
MRTPIVAIMTALFLTTSTAVALAQEDTKKAEEPKKEEEVPEGTKPAEEKPAEDMPKDTPPKEAPPPEDVPEGAPKGVPPVVVEPKVVEAVPVEEPEVVDKVIVVGAHLGVIHPGVSSNLGAHVVATLEGGYILPWLDGRLQAFGSLSYAQPERSGTRVDPRLVDAGGKYKFTTIQREFTIDAGLLARLFPLGERFNAYASLAPRLFLLETETYGEAGGEKFGTNYEQSTKFGFCFAMGGEMILGPGRILLQLGFSYSQLQHEFTGNVPTAALTATAGYRMLF